MSDITSKELKTLYTELDHERNVLEEIMFQTQKRNYQMKYYIDTDKYLCREEDGKKCLCPYTDANIYCGHKCEYFSIENINEPLCILEKHPISDFFNWPCNL